MFRRRYKWFGKIISDEGFTFWFGHKSVYYADERGTFELAFEDGYLVPTVVQTAGKPVRLDQLELEQIIGRVKRGIEYSGILVEVFSKPVEQYCLKKLTSDSPAES